MALRLFLADDSSVVRLSLARRFTAAGITVVEAFNVTTALQIDPKGFDLAVLDLDLGDGYGSSIAKHLRAARPDIPIAFFTSSNEDIITSLLSNDERVFAKPDDADALIAWVFSFIQPG